VFVAIGSTNYLPFAGPHSGTLVEIEGKPKAPAGQGLTTGICVTDANYFQTMQIPLKRGRFFTAQEVSTERHVVIVNETFARKNLPGEDPLGKRVTIYMKDDNQPTEIIGVVGDNKHMGLDTEIEPMAYWPEVELTYSSMTMVIRTTGDATTVASPAREVVRALDGEQPVANVATMETLLAKSVARSRFKHHAADCFCSGRADPSAVGIYGVMSYSVAQRTHEIGIRMALGAQHRDVITLMVRQGAFLGLIGTAAGLAASFGLTRLLATLLFGVSTTDAATFGVVAATLLLVVLIACYIPARRAARVDPLVALRYE